MRLPPNLDAFDADLLLLKDEGVLKDNDIRLIYALLDNGKTAAEAKELIADFNKKLPTPLNKKELERTIYVSIDKKVASQPQP